MCSTSFCAILFAALLTPAQEPLTTAQRQELLRQWDDLRDERDDARRRGEMPRAVEVAGKMVAIERKLYGENDNRLLRSLETFSDLCLTAEMFDRAIVIRKDILAIL